MTEKASGDPTSKEDGSGAGKSYKPKRDRSSSSNYKGAVIQHYLDRKVEINAIFVHFHGEYFQFINMS